MNWATGPPPAGGSSGSPRSTLQMSQVPYCLARLPTASQSLELQAESHQRFIGNCFHFEGLTFPKPVPYATLAPSLCSGSSVDAARSLTQFAAHTGRDKSRVS